MAEKNLDFDRIIDRKNTNCLKYDFAARRNKPEDVQPLWVADMDFKTSSYVQEAIIKQAEHGIFGYSEVRETYFEALYGFMKRHHGWEIKRSWLVKTPGIVFALAMAVKAFTDKGDGVLVQLPVYYPFSEVIENNQRRVVSNTVLQDENGRYYIDFEDFENKIRQERIKLFFLCNPHNPVGRVYTADELTRLGEICLKYGVTVVSDEIHQDFVFKGRHTVFAGLSKEFESISITCTSPSKTFNIAGLQVSNILIPDPGLRKRFKQEVSAAGYSQLNVMGLVACEAAYRNGDEWYYAMLDYVKKNIEFTKEFVKEKLPGVKMTDLEGTYLVWLDFRALMLNAEELEHLIVHKAKLWLDSGDIFGEAGRGFQRINVACPRESLKEALLKLEEAIADIHRLPEKKK